MGRKVRVRARRARMALASGVVALAAFTAACVPEPEPAPTPAGTAAPTTTTTAPPPVGVYEAACDAALVGDTPGSVASAAVDELSGIVASRTTAGVWWVHNDSGGAPALYAIGDDGRNLGTFTLSGATNEDWEDVAVGPGPGGSTSLYVGDIGGKSIPTTRTSIVVYRVAEPAVDPSPASPPAVTLTGVARLTLTYPDGPRDAEALLVDPLTGELYVITKELVTGVAEVYRAQANLAAGSTTALTEVTTVSLGAFRSVTGADVTPAGDAVALRGYNPLSPSSSWVLVYPRSAGEALHGAFARSGCSGATASEEQGEAIGFSPDGRGYVTASEGANPSLHRFRAP